MRLARVAGLAAVAIAIVTAASPARAVETRGDVESDHVSAADDGGPRSIGVLVDPLAMGIGWLGGEIDAALAEPLVFTAEGDVRAFGVPGYGATLGLAFFLQGIALRGIYLHPTVAWAHEHGRGVAVTGIGGGVSAGYEWTAFAGATLRLGAGGTYAKTARAGAGTAVALGGLRPQVDALVGWVF
jgi:hypothetical protein